MIQLMWTDLVQWALLSAIIILAFGSATNPFMQTRTPTKSAGSNEYGYVLSGPRYTVRKSAQDVPLHVQVMLAADADFDCHGKLQAWACTYVLLHAADVLLLVNMLIALGKNV